MQRRIEGKAVELDRGSSIAHLVGIWEEEEEMAGSILGFFLFLKHGCGAVLFVKR